MKKFLSTLAGLLLLSASVWLLFMAIASFGHWLESIPGDLSKTLVTVAGTALLGISSILYSKHLERKQVIEQQLRAQKLPAYESFLHIFMRMSSKDNQPTVAELENFFLEFTEKIMIWGSDDFVKKFGQWKASAANPDQLPMQGLHKMEDLLFSFRKEFGHKNKNLRQGDLLRLFVIDYDAVVRMPPTPIQVEPRGSDPLNRAHVI